MKERTKQLLTVAAGDPPSLAAFLAARLALDEATAAALIGRGVVQVGGARADGAEVLRPGTKVVVRPPAHAPVTPADQALPLLFADEDLLVFDKPAGLLSQPSAGEADSLERRVRERHPEAHLAHRLDRDASGVVLFTRTARAHAAVQQQLAGTAAERIYLAVCAGVLEGERTIRLRIAVDPRDPTRRRALSEREQAGQPAETRVRALGAIRAGDAPATRLEVRLVTGRTHQIRVHLAAVSHPLVGDRLYGGPPAARLLLHAARLAIRHPGTRKRVFFEAPTPHSFST